MSKEPRPKLAVLKFASCDGCQLSLLDCEDELLAALRNGPNRQLSGSIQSDHAGPYDISSGRRLDYHGA